jgi:hypothetical protein
MHAVCRLTKTGDSREKKRRCAILLPKNAREMIASEIAPQCAGPELLGILSLSNSLSLFSLSVRHFGRDQATAGNDVVVGE